MWSQKFATKFIIALLFMLVVLLTIQHGSDKYDFLKRPKNELNFKTEYPEIKPDKCLKTSQFIRGNFKEKMMVTLSTRKI